MDEHHGARFLARRRGRLVSGCRMPHAVADEEMTPVTDRNLKLIEPERE